MATRADDFFDMANPEAERAVLACVLIDPPVIKAIRPMLTAEDFFTIGHRRVYEAMVKLDQNGQGVDFVTVADELATGKPDDLSDLTQLLGGVPTSVHWQYYANIVAERALSRRLLAYSAEVAKLASGKETSEVKLTRAASLLQGIQSNNTRGMVTSAAAAAQFSDKLQDWVDHPREIWGYSSSLHDLDAITGGLGHEYVIIAGRPSMGKSALALQIARHLAEQGLGIMYWSQEMGEELLMMRLVSSMAKVNSDELKKGRVNQADLQRVFDATAKASELPIYWYCYDKPTVAELGAEVSRLRLREKVDVVVVDYMGQMAAETKESQNARVTEISGGLQTIQHREDILLLAVSQLNRSVELRDAKRPRLADLRDSGAIEQDADLVVFVYRPEKYFEEAEKPCPPELQGRAKLVVSKNRSGKTGTAQVLFWDEYGIFADEARRR